jgi:hypothetical protein
MTPRFRRRRGVEGFNRLYVEEIDVCSCSIHHEKRHKFDLLRDVLEGSMIELITKMLTVVK